MSDTRKTRLLTAEFFIYDWDPVRASVSVVQMDGQAYRDSVWLDARIQTRGEETFRSSMREFGEAFTNQVFRPAPVIFHGGHCGSTLLSRVLSASQNVLPLREPIVFGRLVPTFQDLESQTRLMNRKEWNGYAAIVMFSLSRTYGAEQTAMIKGTSVCNALILPLLENKLMNHALLLFQPLRNHLASFLCVDEPLTVALRTHAPIKMRDWMNIPGTPKLYVNELSVSQMAVVAWLRDVYLMVQAKRRFPDNCKLLNFNIFLDSPHDSVRDITDWCGLQSEQGTLLVNLEQTMSRNSKHSNETFSANHRQEKYLEVYEKKSQEINEAMQWAVELTENVDALSICREHLGES